MEVTMNYKLYVLIFTLPLAVSPALQAMRVPRTSSVLAAASLMRRPLWRSEQLRAYSTKKNERERFKEEFKHESHKSSGNKYWPSAIAVGLGGTALYAYWLQQSSHPIDPSKVYVKDEISSSRDTLSKPDVKLVALLTIDSRKVLENVEQTRDRFYRELNSLDNGTNTELLFKTLLKKYEAECPIFMLGECNTQCGLTRKHWPQYRAAFEERTSLLLLEKLQPGQTVHYAAFASGDLFQDLVVLSKTLKMKPDASIVINIVDNNLTPYVYCRDVSSTTREVQENYTLQTQPIRREIIEHARKVWSAAKFDDNSIIEEISNECLNRETLLKQFLVTLKRNHPQANLTLFVHDSAQSYLDYIDKNQLPYPDVIATADIQDELSAMRGAAESYVSLCIKVLQKKPNASNVWLAHNYYVANSAYLQSLSLEESTDAAKEAFEFEYEPNKSVVCYYQLEELAPREIWGQEIVTNKV